MPDLLKLSTTLHYDGSMKDSLNSDIASETTPLLPAVVQGPRRNDETDQSFSQQAPVHNSPGERDEDGDDAKPLPKFQVALLCFARVAEPVRTLLLAP